MVPKTPGVSYSLYILYNRNQMQITQWHGPVWTECYYKYEWINTIKLCKAADEASIIVVSGGFYCETTM